MKKRLLCLLLALLMICSFLMTSCGNEKTDDEIRKENVLRKQEQTYTLSLWIPTNADTASPKFQARLEAVENAINDILVSDNTKIKIVAVSDAEYEAKLNEKFTQVKGSQLAKPAEVGKNYINTVEKNYPDPSNTEDYFYQLQYPKILDNQIDICLIRDYDTYTSLAKSGMLYAINGYVTSESASYPRLKKMIRNEFMAPLMIDKNLYGLPNNRAYVEDNYKYLLINKELASSADVAINTGDIKSVLDCEELINKIGALNLNGVVPYVGAANDFAGLKYWGAEQSLITSTTTSPRPDSILNNEGFIAYTKLYKDLSEKNYVKTELSDGEIAGVISYSGTKAGAEAYANDYYLVMTEAPTMTQEDVYGSMFAISDYSINYDRAMSVLYLMHTNVEIRTLLQYGIEDVDYVLDYSEDEENPTIKLIKDESNNVVYDMNNKYTGNGYITYREEGSVIDDWDYVQSVNYDAVISNLLNLKSNYDEKSTDAKYCLTCHKILAVNEIRLDAQTKKNVCFKCKNEPTALKPLTDELTVELKSLSAEVLPEIYAMSYAEFESFMIAYEASKEMASIEKQLADGLEQYNALKPDEQAKKDKIEANNALIEENKDSTDEAVKAEMEELKKENETLAAEIEKIATYDELIQKKAIYTSNETLNKILASDAYATCVNLYAAINQSYNK